MTLTKKTAKRWPSERRLKSQPGEGKKTLRYTRDAREIRQAVNNETLHQRGDACGVLSLREVELSRRIQCFPEKHTQRERTAFTASSPSLSSSHASLPSLPHPGPTISRNALLFFIVYFFAPRIPTCTLQHHLSEAEPGQGLSFAS